MRESNSRNKQDFEKNIKCSFYFTDVPNKTFSNIDEVRQNLFVGNPNKSVWHLFSVKMIYKKRNKICYCTAIAAVFRDNYK